MLTLPQHRHAELRKQLALLDRTVQERYTFPAHFLTPMPGAGTTKDENVARLTALII
jgi:hypothetical protein